MTNDEKDLDKILSGSKGIVYLMFVGREANTAKVVKTLVEGHIVKDPNSIYGSINHLKKSGFIKTVRVLSEPGPPKIRTANLQPIFDTVSFYRAWKMIPEDNQQLTNDEKKKMTSLFESMAPLLDYFPKYLSLSVEVSRKKIRSLHWIETLGVFYEFCLRTVEACWSIREFNMDLKFLSSMLKRQKHRITNLLFEPYRYIYDVLQRNEVTMETISTLASFSVNGDKDIYSDTFVRELHLTCISLKNPLAAYAEYNRIKDTAPRRAILEKLEQELHGIQHDLEKTANHKVKDMNGILEEIIRRVEFLREYIKKVG